jgi:hypothetical protein
MREAAWNRGSIPALIAPETLSGGRANVRELVIATVGALTLIAVGLATLNANEHRRADAAASAGEEDSPQGMPHSMALRLAD